jgi:hypothetical protein
MNDIISRDMAIEHPHCVLYLLNCFYAEGRMDVTITPSLCNPIEIRPLPHPSSEEKDFPAKLLTIQRYNAK